MKIVSGNRNKSSLILCYCEITNVNRTIAIGTNFIRPLDWTGIGNWGRYIAQWRVLIPNSMLRKATGCGPVCNRFRQQTTCGWFPAPGKSAQSHRDSDHKGRWFVMKYDGFGKHFLLCPSKSFHVAVFVFVFLFFLSFFSTYHNWSTTIAATILMLRCYLWLTHYHHVVRCLVPPYGGIHLDQHWLM